MRNQLMLFICNQLDPVFKVTAKHVKIITLYITHIIYITLNYSVLNILWCQKRKL